MSSEKFRFIVNKPEKVPPSHSKKAMAQWNHDKPKKEVPMNTYYTICKNCKDKSTYRKQLVQYALKYGKKKAAREFKTTVKTVRKWVARWQQGKLNALKDISQKPHNSPNKIKPYWEFRIRDICLKALADNKRINAARIKKRLLHSLLPKNYS